MEQKCDVVYLDLRLLRAAATMTPAPTSRLQHHPPGEHSLRRQQEQQEPARRGTGSAVDRRLEAAAARACDGSLRGRVWRRVVSVLAAIPSGPTGPRSMTVVSPSPDDATRPDQEPAARGGGGGAAATAAPGYDPWVGLLQLELQCRYPVAAAAAATDPLQEQSAAVAAAKRSLVRLLVAAPPPHQLDFQLVGEQLPQLLGGGRQARNLWLLCAEEPSVLQVVPQGERHYAVRLVCPTLLALAGQPHQRGLLQQLQQQRDLHAKKW